MSNKKPVKARKKSFTMNKLDQQYKDLNKWSEYVLDAEDNLVIKYKEKFDEKKIDDLLMEAALNMEFLKENDLELFSEGIEGDDEFLKYIYLLMIKYFTDFGQAMPDTIVEQLEALDKLESVGLFRVIFEEVFNPAEVEKVVDRVREKVMLLQNIEKMILKSQKEIEEKVKNPEVLEALKRHNIQHPIMNPEGKDYA